MGMRGIRDEDIADILRKTVIIGKDAARATQQILDLKGMTAYLRSFDSEAESEHFTRHLRKYVNMYLPDCPFEINTTNRYTITNFEAAATARKQIKKGDVIKYLSGIQVPMTKEEEKHLDVTRRDFSIVMSSRKKTPSLFLGPARFANHDCDANARLSTRGSNGMQIVAIREIQVDEEITVSYGQDYFGEDNCECLCGTCEKLLRNGWDPNKKERESDDEEDDEQEEPNIEDETKQAENALENPYEFRKKRKYEAAFALESSDESDRAVKQPKMSPANNISSPTFDSLVQQMDQTTGMFIKMERTSSDSSDSLLSPAVIACSQEGPLLNPHRRAMMAYSKTSRDSSSTVDTCGREASQTFSVDEAGTNSTAATSPSFFDEAPRQPSPPKRESQDSQDEIVIEVENTDSQSVLTDLSSTCEFDDTSKTIVKRRRTRYQSAIRPSSSHNHTETGSNLRSSNAPQSSGEGGEGMNKRRPGDYVGTPTLLSVAYSRWNTCTNDTYSGSTLHFPPATTWVSFPSTKSKVQVLQQSNHSSGCFASHENGCERPFVQQDGYRTRAACPRCERHMMLYGYAWPKTDRENKKDDEERITDHRTVHRFLSAESERRKRNGLPLRTDDDDSDVDERPTKSKKKEKAGVKDLLRTVMEGSILKGKYNKAKGLTSRSRKAAIYSLQTATKSGAKMGRPPNSVGVLPKVEKPIFTKSGREVIKKDSARPKKEEKNKYKPSPWKGWVFVED